MKHTIFFCLIRFFSVILLCVRNIFAMIRLPSFSTNINGNEVCTKKFNQILKKNQIWCIYFLMLILKRGRIIVIIKKEEKATLKTNDKSEKFKGMINFSVYIFLCWRRKPKNKFNKYITIIKATLHWFSV